MEQNENDIDTARGMSWCKIHKYWYDNGKGCLDCKSSSINKANLSKQMLDKAKLQAGLEVKDGS